MTTAKFDKNAQAAADAVNTGNKPSANTNPRANAAMANVPFTDCTGVIGTEGPATVKIRWLEIVHGTSGTAKKDGLPLGAMVLGKEFVLAKAKETLRMIVVGYRYSYRQYEYQNGRDPAEFGTAAEARAAGFTTEKVGDTYPTCPQCVVLRVLIEKPTKDFFCPAFRIRIGDKDYAAAYIRIEKSSMRRSGDRIKEMIDYTSNNGIALPQVEWKVTSDIYTAKTTGNEVYVFDFRYDPTIRTVESFKALTTACRPALNPAEATVNDGDEEGPEAAQA